MQVIENPQRTCKEVRRGSDTLVIVFNSWIFEPGRHEFGRTIMRHRFDALWVSDLSRRFFMDGATDFAADADALAGRLREKASRYRRTICIGASMGGTGSLVFGAEIGADLTINFGPQTALRQYGGLDQMLTLGVWKEMYEDMEARWRADPAGPLGRRWDVCRHVAALPGPSVPHLVLVPLADIRDLYDAWRIATLLPSAKVFEVERDGHPGARRLIEAGIVQDWLDCCDRPGPVAPAVFRLCRRYLNEHRAPVSRLRRDWRRLRLGLRRRRGRREALLIDGLQPREARRDPRDA